MKSRIARSRGVGQSERRETLAGCGRKHSLPWCYHDGGKRKMHRTDSETLGAHGHIRTDNPDQEKGDHNSPANTDHPALTLDDLTVLEGPDHPVPC